MRTFLMLTVAVCGLAALYPGVVDQALAQPVPPPASQQVIVEHNRLVGVDMTEIAEQLANGSITSEQLVTRYLHRMSELDDGDGGVNAVVALYANALPLARTLDVERAAGRLRGPLHGIPILLKDNIEAIGEHPTTGGSLALARNVTGRDSPLVARLRAAGAIILGRTNLSEWANFRDGDSTSGWSAMWGLTRNPNLLDRTACGSSSGSGAAVAANFASAAIGTETDGSIVCPAGTNGIVGFKPTLGLISRRHIIPISASQDTAGPMTVSVRDAALLMTVMAGTDPQDPATAEADARRANYVTALNPEALRGMRIGVMRDQLGSDPRIATMVDQSVAVMRERGANIVDIRNDSIDRQTIGAAEFTVLLTEFREDLNAYLASTPVAGMPRTLAELIAFNQTEPRELRWFGQSLFVQAEATGAAGGRTSEAYRATLATARRLAGPEGIDRLRREHNVDILLAVTNGPAWSIDLINGDRFVGPSASQLPAVAGYPHLTVPMGRVHGLPIGLSFIGTRWDDARVLAAGHAFELATPFRIGGTPGFRQRIDLNR
jgi:amidase